MIVTHPFVSAKADGGDATLIRPSNWNAVHTSTIEAVDGATLAVLQKSRRTEFVDFESSFEQSPLRARASGTGASASLSISPVNSQVGVRGLDTGTTATGNASIEANSDAVRGQGVLVYEQDLLIPILSTAAEEYIIRLGFQDSWTGTPVDGAFFIYDRLGGPNWFRETSSSSVVTSIDTGVLVDVNNHVFRVELTTSEARFFIDGTEIGLPITTNIPAARAFGWGTTIIKSAGVTSRTCNVDYMRWDFNLSPARA